MKKEALVSNKTNKERNPRKRLASATLAATLLLSACSEILGTTEPTKFDSYEQAIAELDALHKAEDNKSDEKAEQAMAGATPLIRKHVVSEVEKLVQDKSGDYDFTGENGMSRHLSISTGESSNGKRSSLVEISNEISKNHTEYQTLFVSYDEDGKPSVSFNNKPNENEYDSLEIPSEGREIEAFHGFDIDEDGKFYEDDDPFYGAAFNGDTFGINSDPINDIGDVLDSVREVEKFLGVANTVASVVTK